MSEQNKFETILEQLDPKSALLVGAIGGLLTLGTLGFIILGTLVLQGKINIKTTGESSSEVVVAQPTQQPAVQQPAQQAPANVPKSNKPKVELFVMSYCPYGLQMEKAYVPAWELLKNKADISLKFVNYAMHGQKEVEENTRQYCIGKDQPAKLANYLKCFYKGANGAAPDYNDCLKSAGVNVASLNSCYDNADKQFGITAKLEDKGSWLSGQFPIYPVHSADNTKYGVQGSPTLVINGVQSQAGRTPEAIKTAICNAFNNQPSECGQQLANTPFQPGFGL
jgi:protein-disulfide isomerase